MRTSSSHEPDADAARPPLTWVESMGGPLIAVPVSMLDHWGGSTMEGGQAGSGAVVDDYDRACEIEDLAALITVGTSGSQALLLADEPASTCYLSEQRTFIRWLAADSESALLSAAEAALADPATKWENCGVWETEGPAVLMDSAEAGADLNVEYPNGGGFPAHALVPLPAGRWSVRAARTWEGQLTAVCLIQLISAAS
ncbi:Imm21 family immunity protein [Streptomyces sp. NPDC057694]|uniref:Imm21 family immunity protein n=1 Tax=Streptomyces sp. NPDC057694 TaxID=3346216 RepID=UPI0036B5F34B